MVERPEVNDRLCFVLMPFRQPFDDYYEHILKPAVGAADMEVLRADEIYGTGIVIRDVWHSIWRARLIIADVTKRNPNVNYELGLCHALGVPTILITQKMDDVPFDYRQRRCIVYDTRKTRWEDRLKADLGKTITSALKSPNDEHDLPWPYRAGPAMSPNQDRANQELQEQLMIARTETTALRARLEMMSRAPDESVGGQGGMLFEILADKLERFARPPDVNSKAPMWATEPNLRDKETAGLNVMVRFLGEQELPLEDRALLLKTEWLIARARKLSTDKQEEGTDSPLNEAKALITKVLDHLSKRLMESV